MKKKFYPFLFTLLTLLVILLARCGSKPDTVTAPASGTFGSVYTALKNNSCTECHIPTGAAFQSGVKLDFTSQTTAYTTLTTLKASATDIVGTCGTAKIVTAGDPSKSYLAAVLFTKFSISNFAGISGCTPYNAHLTQYNLSAAEQTSITDWITNGALNN